MVEDVHPEENRGPIITIHIDMSPVGEGTIRGTFSRMLQTSALPPLFQKRGLRSKVALLRVLAWEFNRSPSVQLARWALLFPRSRGQDLEVDIVVKARREFPVVVYAYEAEDSVEPPLALNRMRDMGMGLAELSGAD